MARINIEDSIFQNANYMDLILSVGCKFKAIGIITILFKEAQKYWVPNRQPIPKQIFTKLGFPDSIIDLGFVDELNDGFYVKGSEDAFNWLIEKHEQAKEAGKRSAEVRKQNFGSAQPISNVKQESTNETRTTVERSLDSAERPSTSPNVDPTEPNALTLTPTLSLTLTPTLDINITKPPKKLKPDPITELNQKVWEAYSNAYFVRYKTEPIRNAKINSQISQIAKRLGVEAIEVVKFYLSHNDSFYLKNLHSLGLCLNSAESLRTQWARGRAITGRDVHNFEKSSSHQNLINDILENGI